MGSLYSKLTGNPAANAWTTFIAAVNALAGGVQSDDPFNALGAPAPAPAPTPAPTPTPAPSTSATELASLMLSAIGADLVAGNTEAQLKADIQSILDAN